MDEDRNDLGTTARDLQMWEIITAIPQMTFLAIFYVMLVDIDTYYDDTPSTEANSFIFIFSSYSDSYSTWAEDFATTQNTFLENFYGVAYAIVAVYLNPVVWVQYVIDKITAFYDYIIS